MDDSLKKLAQEIATKFMRGCLTREALTDEGVVKYDTNLEALANAIEHQLLTIRQQTIAEKDAQIERMKMFYQTEMAQKVAELQEFKDCYDAGKSGLRQDEAHCACAYELQRELKSARQEAREAALADICRQIEFCGFGAMGWRMKLIDKLKEKS